MSNAFSVVFDFTIIDPATLVTSKSLDKIREEIANFMPTDHRGATIGGLA